ncbi:MAG: glycosyltransferase [Gemmobacter sp.]|nr:glycosyltransferase [Gemmobacter sp.]
MARQSRFADVSDQRGRRPEGNVILSVARYDLHQKQQHVLIEAFARIADRYPDWRLDLYGDDWNEGKARLAELIAAYGLENRVGLHGHSGNVAARMRKAQILAFPSAFEGWGLAATEALSHGLPVIAFAECSGVNSLVLDGVNGVLVDGPVTGIEAFAAGLERLMADEALRKRLAAAAPASVAPYSVEEFLHKWDALLREAAALRGQNRLAKLSFMERDYLRLVANGKLFEQAHAERKKHRDLAQRLRAGQEVVAPKRSLKAVLRGLAPVGLWRLLHRGRKALRRLRRG